MILSQFWHTGSQYRIFIVISKFELETKSTIDSVWYRINIKFKAGCLIDGISIDGIQIHKMNLNSITIHQWWWIVTKNNHKLQIVSMYP